MAQLLLPLAVAVQRARALWSVVFGTQAGFHLVSAPFSDALPRAFGCREPFPFQAAALAEFTRAVQNPVMVALDFPQAHKEVELFAGVVDVLSQFFDSSRSLEELFTLAQITALALAQQAGRCQFFKLHVAVELDVLAHPLLRRIAGTLYHDRFAFNYVQDDEMSRENDDSDVRFWIFNVKGKNFRSLPILSVHQTLNKNRETSQSPGCVHVVVRAARVSELLERSRLSPDEGSCPSYVPTPVLRRVYVSHFLTGRVAVQLASVSPARRLWRTVSPCMQGASSYT